MAKPKLVDIDVTVPDNGDDLATLMSDMSTFKALDNPDKLYSLVHKYGEKMQGRGTELHEKVEDEAYKGLITALREGGIEGARLALSPQDTPKAAFKTARHMAIHAPQNALSQKYDGEFTSSGDFFRSIHWAELKRNPEARARLDRMTNAYGSIVPADGGVLIPEILRSSLLSVALESSIVRSRATVIPMESLRVDLPMLDVTTNVGSVFGGMVAYWLEEGATFTDASAKFGAVRLEAKNLTGYSEVPNQLLADSAISFAAFIEAQWPKTLSWFEDMAFLTGDGVGKPLGMIGAQNPAAIAVAAESGQAASTIVWENLVKMFSRMLPSSLGSAVWLASPDTFPELATMALSVGTGGAPVWLSNGAAGPPMTILGRPVIFTEKISKLGTRGDIAFVDPSYYVVGDRQQMSADSSEHIKFNQYKTAFRIIERVDGQPWIQSAITPANTGPTLSPFVELATR